MRTDTPKAFLPLHGRPLFTHSLQTLSRLTAAHSLVLVVPANRVAEARRLVELQEPCTVPLHITAGGAERQDSVAAGLLRAGSADFVLVHDAARPFISLTGARACVQAAEATGAAILALPARDTVKLVQEDSTITQTLDRAQVWLAQTPQVFRTDLLRQAYARARTEGYAATDDASLLERLGIPVTVVPGEENNRKITTPDDWRWATWHAAEENE
jgi:2-C-methyl-D-erythritol 4-phosphate cytidylyltransferase